MAVVSPPVAALERWKQLKFQQIQNELDTAAADIAARQEESESGRKRLIELSREFRQTTSEEVRRQVQPLLKSFQTEVDSLVKRSKSAETAFLDVYKTFADLPDPTSIVEYLAHLEEKVVENKQLRETLEEYDRQVIANKAQEAKLTRDQLAEADLKIEAAVQTRLKSEVDLLTAEFAERQAELALEKSAMERKLTDAQDQVGILRRELDRSHVEMSRARMMTGQTQDEKITLFAEDLDRATDRAASAEYKISELEQQVTSLQKQINTKTQESPNGNVEVPVSRSQQNQQDAVQRLRDELDRLKGSYQTQFDRMEDQLTRLSSQNTLLLRKLDAQRDYDEMKQQLSLLKSVNYSDDLTGGSLESILASRNRRLENDNAALRVRESELAESLRTLEAEHLKQSDLMREQTKLMERLESDLYHLKEMSSSALGVKDTLSGLSLTEPDFVTDALRSESAHSPLHFPPQHSLSFDGAAEASTRDVRLGASYLPILERQHERFHSKIKELEQTNHEIQSRSIALKTEMDAVKVDNVRLYERIRFLQSYEGRKSAGDQRGGGSVSVSLPGATNTSTDAESRYSSAYEANLDPFSSFHRAEKQRKYDALNPVDKATLAMGNMVLGSPISRKAFFIYALLLHLLIFAVVYKMAWSESSIRDFSYDCSSRFADHMKNVHGGNDDHVHNH